METEEMEMSVEEAMDLSADEDEDVDVDVDENDEPMLVEPADSSTALASAPTSTTAPADPHVCARHCPCCHCCCCRRRGFVRGCVGGG